MIAAARGVELADERGTNAAYGELAGDGRPGRRTEDATRPRRARLEREPAGSDPREAEGAGVECKVEQRLAGAQLRREAGVIGADRRFRIR